MDMIITPDCPQCHGTGRLPFPGRHPDDLIAQIPCGACLKRWDDANPLPPRPDPRDAELAALRARLAACERFVAACAQLDRFEAADDRARVAWAVDHSRALGALPREEG